MASGDFHDSDFHSGDFHFSSDFSSGDYSGGSYDSGYDFDGSSRRGRSNISDRKYLILLFILVPGIDFLIDFRFLLITELVSTHNLIRLFIYAVCGLLFFLSIRQSKRTSALTGLRRDGMSDHYVYSSVNSGDWTGTPEALAGKDNKMYRIAFGGLEYGYMNCDEVLKTMERTPRIIWIRPGTWLAVSILLFFVDLHFYEAVIPFFERMVMSDFAFEFFDVLTFFLPSFLVLGCAVLSLVFVYVRDNILYECAVRLASEIRTNEKKIETELLLRSVNGKKWYHIFCPNCGTKANASITHCISCGSSLEVIEGDRNLYSIRRVSDDKGLKE